MFSLINPSTRHRDELVAVTRSGKLLLEAAIRAKLDDSTRGQWYPIFLAQTRIAREYFLSIELDGLEEWDALPALKFRHAVQEATRSAAIEEWDAPRIETALIDFNNTWQAANKDHAPQQPSNIAESEPQAVQLSSTEGAVPRELKKLDERIRRVYCACRVAVDELAQLTALDAITKQQVWKWLKTNSQEGYEVPEFGSFERYLRAIPKTVPDLFPKQRRASKQRAQGRSIVPQRDL
ncbi:hypothetical protein VT84_17890 [Gemmata sp. SH-PL17]|uniref:hypothetical protein n=1 Tax=Gemmata sp. SH-PL17 TaxID=1630693 RepID=UPI00078CE1FC|nr:hypothetical protein [Gemmata sp. SH-PL17]AMV26274.1 hypothetical protein VT84_17890 [Gemmata sp. SH-PL17]